jgi:hypothetical protein
MKNEKLILVVALMCALFTTTASHYCLAHQQAQYSANISPPRIQVSDAHPWRENSPPSSVTVTVHSD